MTPKAKDTAEPKFKSWTPHQNLEALDLLRSYCPKAVHAHEFAAYLERIAENHLVSIHPGEEGARCYRADCEERSVGFQAARFFRRLGDLLEEKGS